ncbi:hypothetical protein QO010_003243 [Caulobacter ginsengisoli]|uniref:Uncharacterized protein n=1 Tax=Caulobacter ginsengisoli TaxID=400775 RepID=A0ABU0ITX3_9CAUL|nr:hypothetical protein [Caulobacter ginsengisoli]MDQ0465456.1 hypothetical protein [Caulobacter ginsengisoli]
MTTAPGTTWTWFSRRWTPAGAVKGPGLTYARLRLVTALLVFALCVLILAAGLTAAFLHSQGALVAALLLTAASVACTATNHGAMAWAVLRIGAWTLKSRERVRRDEQPGRFWLHLVPQIVYAILFAATAVLLAVAAVSAASMSSDL